MSVARLGACGSLVVLLASTVAAGGCRQIVGIESNPEPPLASARGPEATPTACRGIAYANTACANCMAASCCAEVDRCAAASECKSVVECVAACPANDLACAAGCRTRFPAGYSTEAAEVGSCAARSCAAECTVGSCGGYVYPDASCGACGAAKCCGVANACMQQTSCAVVAACERACKTGDAACLRRCELTHPAGVEGERAFGACLATECPSCVPPRWACLSPTPTTTPIPTVPRAFRLTFSFFDFGSGTPVEGITVKACRRTDVECATPMASPVVTDASGRAVLVVPDALSYGYAEVDGGDYGPVLLYVPGVQEDRVLNALPLAKRSTILSLGSALAVIDPERATIAFNLLDCLGAGAGGVSVSVEPNDAVTVPFYFKGRLPSKDATETEEDYAAGGFGNALAGRVLTLRATVAANGRRYPDVPVYTRKTPGGYTSVAWRAAP